MMEASVYANSTESSRSKNIAHPVMHDLISRRKGLPKSDAAKRTELSKQVSKEIRQIKGEQRSEQTGQYLQTFSNLRAIGGIKSCKRKD